MIIEHKISANVIERRASARRGNLTSTIKHADLMHDAQYFIEKVRLPRRYAPRNDDTTPVSYGGEYNQDIF